MMRRSTQELRKGKGKYAAPDAGTVVLLKLSRAASEARKATMATISELVNNAAEKNGGRVPFGFIPQVIQQFSNVVPGLTRDKIKHYYKKEYKNKRKRGLPQNDGRGATSNGSALVVTPDEPLLASSLPQDDASPPTKRQKGGRPKGTTLKSSQAELTLYKKACDEAARDFQSAVDEVAESGKCRMKQGLLDQIIQDTKRRNKLEHLEISKKMIRMRISRRSLAPPHRGLVSPMEQIEPMLVELCIRLGRARQPMKCKNFIPLVNSIIKGTLTEKEVIEFKARYSHGDKKSESAELGKGYYNGFLKRNGHRLVSKRGEKFAANRAEWSTYENFVKMYDGVYDEMVDSGVAERLPSPVWMDAEGNIVDSEDEAFGLQVDTVLKHPDHVFTVDEVGNNTNQKNDGHIGGGRFLCERGTTPKQICSTKDAHFTVLGFTSANGQPVMCVIIFEGEQVKLDWATGIDIQQISIGEKHDPEYFEANSGPGKLLPGGPKCEFRGKTIPCQCYAAPSGSITSEILKNCLQKLDELKLFPRVPGGPNPFLLLDGHGSRFELPFMVYINDPQTTWFVCIGVPYGTSYWQVGDSAEQNGCFKMKNTEAKEILVAWKASHGLPIMIEKTDIVPIVNFGWARSFARTRTNLTATAARGWNPLNRALLLHPEIAGTAAQVQEQAENNLEEFPQSTTPTSAALFVPDDINTTDGSAGDVYDILLRNADKEAARKRRKEQQQRGELMVQQVEGIKRLTAGVHFHANGVRIGETALQRVKAQYRKREDEQRNKEQKKKNELRDRRKKAMEVRALNRPEEEWTKPQLKAMCLYKKAPGDKGLPDSLPLLQQCWHERRGRLSPPLSPANSDDELDVEEISFATTTARTARPTTHVGLNSPGDLSTLSDITNMPPMHAPEREESIADCEQGMMQMQRIEM
jgi:hypothetical protein